MMAKAASKKGQIQKYDPKTPVGRHLKNFIEERKPSMLAWLSEEQADKFAMCMMVAAAKVPALYRCTHESWALAMMDCSRSKLLPDGDLAALVPYGMDVQYMLMYKGMIAALKRSGDLKDIWAKRVYEKDVFEDRGGTINRGIEHIASRLPVAERGAVTHVYAACELVDGTVPFVVLDIEYVNKIKEAALKNKKSPEVPWRKWEEAMQLKTAIKALLKVVPLSEAAAEIVATDNRIEGAVVAMDNVVDMAPEDVPEDPSASIVERLKGEEQEATPQEDKTSAPPSKTPEPPAEPDPEPEYDSTMPQGMDDEPPAELFAKE